MEMKNYVMPIAAVAVAIIFGYIVYSVGFGLIGEGHGAGSAEKMLLAALEKPEQHSNYTYEYVEDIDGYRSTISIVETPEYSIVKSRNAFFEKAVYSNASGDAVCILFNGKEKCSLASGDAELEKSAQTSKALLFSQNAEPALKKIRLGIEFGAVEFIGEPEKTTANGKECGLVKYAQDYSHLTLGQLNDMGVSASSAEVLAVKNFTYSACIDDEYNFVSQKFEYIYFGEWKKTEIKVLKSEWGAVNGSFSVPELVNANETKDLFIEALSARNTVLACAKTAASDECVKTYAIQNAQPYVCTLAGSKKDICILSTIAIAPAPDLCSEVSNSSMKDDCWVEVAAATEDDSLCANIADGTKRELCSNVSGGNAPECATDADCFAAGCSGQLCVPESEKGTITTCEWKDEYGCLNLTSCGCMEGKCAWASNQNYTDCVAGTR